MPFQNDVRQKPLHEAKLDLKHLETFEKFEVKKKLKFLYVDITHISSVNSGVFRGQTKRGAKDGHLEQKLKSNFLSLEQLRSTFVFLEAKAVKQIAQIKSVHQSYEDQNSVITEEKNFLLNITSCFLHNDCA